MTNPEEDSNQPHGLTSGGGEPESEARPSQHKSADASATSDDMVDEFSDGEENEPPGR